MYIGDSFPSGPTMPVSCRNLNAFSFEDVTSFIAASNFSALSFSSFEFIIISSLSAKLNEYVEIAKGYEFFLFYVLSAYSPFQIQNRPMLTAPTCVLLSKREKCQCRQCVPMMQRYSFFFSYPHLSFKSCQNINSMKYMVS